jgi:DNA polymerase III epsilon subunit family exonuclease
MAELKNPLVVVLDVETTGLEPAAGHEVLEIGAQKIQGRQVVAEYEALIKPTQPLPKDVVAFHQNNGLTWELLQTKGRPTEEVINELVEFIGDAVIVAHNAPFDIGFINEHLKRLGKPALTNRSIDTLDIAKKYLILPSYKLGKVAAYFKIPVTTAHRALADVITCREIFFKLIDRAKRGG